MPRRRKPRKPDDVVDQTAFVQNHVTLYSGTLRKRGEDWVLEDAVWIPEPLDFVEDQELGEDLNAVGSLPARHRYAEPIVIPKRAMRRVCEEVRTKPRVYAR